MPHMSKRPFIRKIKRKRHGAAFWDHEYAASRSGDESHLALSDDPAEDLEKFVRWLSRQKNELGIDKNTKVIDLGTGNGRHLIYLYREFEATGAGFDISSAAIAEAKNRANGLLLEFSVRSIEGELPFPDASQDLVLDMMTSHFLDANKRDYLLSEIFRVLRPGGWLFMKTFLRDGDLHSERLLKERPANEPGTYIHPVIGVPEHVYGEEELADFLTKKFLIRKISRSHKHVSRGKARKRRTISVYAQKDPYK